jgi:hypothetical protein
MFNDKIRVNQDIDEWIDIIKEFGLIDSKTGQDLTNHLISFLEDLK